MYIAAPESTVNAPHYMTGHGITKMPSLNICISTSPTNSDVPVACSRDDRNAVQGRELKRHIGSLLRLYTYVYTCVHVYIHTPRDMYIYIYTDR